QSRLARIREAKAALEKEAREHLQTLERAAEARKPGRLGRPRKEESAAWKALTEEQRRERSVAKKQLQRARQNAVAPSRQYNFVDPDSRLMLDMGRKGFVQGYNAQIAADA